MVRLRIGFSALLAFGLAAFLLPVAPVTAATPADATQPPDVARVSLLRGTVDIKRADSGDTVLATINAPLGVGDYVATQGDARAEIQFGYATALRVAADTSLRFAALDRDHRRVQLASGTIEVSLGHGTRAHAEIETPHATIQPNETGRYRVAVAKDGATTVTVRSGAADVITDNGTRTLDAGAALAIGGAAGDATIGTVVAENGDDFDRFNDDRDRTAARTASEVYVDDAMVGAEDLETYGHWIENPRYGRVWSPYETAGWAPYHDGRFVWEPYYGWTWVAAEPWGWAPYHYGNWFYTAGSGWCWYPGAYAFDQPFVYRPAIVSFFSFGGGGTSFGFENIGWVPLAPYETFSPWYGGYGYGYGYGNTTVINNTVINNNPTSVTIVSAPPAPSGNVFTIYHNGSAPGGAVAVDRRSFADGNFTNVASVAPKTLAHAAPVRGIVPIVPTADNLRFAPRHDVAAPIAAAPGPRVDVGFTRFAPPRFHTEPFAAQQADVRAETAAARAERSRPYVLRPSIRPVTIDTITATPRIARPSIATGATIVHPGTNAPGTRVQPVQIFDGADAPRTRHDFVGTTPRVMQRFVEPRQPQAEGSTHVGSGSERNADMPPVYAQHAYARPVTNMQATRVLVEPVHPPAAAPAHAVTNSVRAVPAAARVERASPVTSHVVAH